MVQGDHDGLGGGLLGDLVEGEGYVDGVVLVIQEGLGS